MYEYEALNHENLEAVLGVILDCILDAYSSGATEATIYLDHALAYRYVMDWSRGWNRRAGPGGTWRDSQGTVFFLVIAQSASVSTETAVKFAFCYRPFRQSRAISAQVENDLPSTTTRTIAS